MAIPLRFHLLLVLISAATANSGDSNAAAANFSVILSTLHFHQITTTNLSSIIAPLVSVSDLSPAESMPSAPSHPPISNMSIMLNDAIIRLQNTGYRVVSVALSFKHVELSKLDAVTVFALDDASIFSDESSAYLSKFWCHVVPKKWLTAAGLMRLPPRTPMPTMDVGRNLVVTVAGDGEPVDLIEINCAEIDVVDLLINSKIAVHGTSSPFRCSQQYDEGFETKLSTVGDIQRPNSIKLNRTIESVRYDLRYPTRYNQRWILKIKFAN